MAESAPTGFRKSSYCQEGNCLEVALLENGSIALRDSAEPGLPHYTCTAAEWRAFVRGVKSGEFDFDLPGLD